MLLTWVVNSARGSMLVAMVFHAGLNTALTTLYEPPSSLAVQCVRSPVTGSLLEQLQAREAVARTPGWRRCGPRWVRLPWRSARLRGDAVGVAGLVNPSSFV